MGNKHFTVHRCGCLHDKKGARALDKLYSHLDDRTLPRRPRNARHRIFHHITGLTDNLIGKFNKHSKWLLLADRQWSRTQKWRFQNNEL